MDPATSSIRSKVEGPGFMPQHTMAQSCLIPHYDKVLSNSGCLRLQMAASGHFPTLSLP